MPRVSSSSGPVGTVPGFGGASVDGATATSTVDTYVSGHTGSTSRPHPVTPGAPSPVGVRAHATLAGTGASAATAWPSVGHTASTSDAVAAYVAPGPQLYPALSDDALLAALRAAYLPTTHHNYKTARGFLYGEVDNPTGTARCVYTGRTLKTHGIPNAGGPKGMNTEHTFPQSWLKQRPAALSDLHHLFPADTFANEMRSSYPFGEVVHTTWVSPDGQAKLGENAHGALVFEPPDEHKGNVARAMFYISGLYDVPLSASHEAVLRKWADADPVDADEVARNARVKAVQGNTNPFIDSPALEKRVADF